MSSPDSSWVLEIEFPRPYSGVSISYSQDGELVVSIPFNSESSAEIARGEMEVSVRPVVRVIDGEVLEGEQGR